MELNAWPPGARKVEPEVRTYFTRSSLWKLSDVAPGGLTSSMDVAEIKYVGLHIDS